MTEIMKCQVYIFLVILYLLAQVYTQQLVSPCPRFFKYEPNSSESGRWYGTITLLSESESTGVSLRLILDKPSVQLGNWFGEVDTQDNEEYLIENRNHKLLPNTSYQLRFYIKYNPAVTPPQLTGIRLNGKTVCPESEAATEIPTPSDLLITTSKPTGFSSGGTFGSFYQQQGTSEEDDFFHGDFSVFNKLNKPIAIGVSAACGTVMASRPLFLYGEATREGEFPWHAALYRAKGIDQTYFCGASLVSKYHLITVAHCVTRRKSQETLDLDSLKVYLGKYDLKTWSNVGIQEKHVSKITVHPKYKAETYTNNIAIIKLASPIEITNYVRPVCLWDEDVNLQAVVDKAGTVAGWGLDKTGRVTEKLTKAQMTVVTQETCIYSFPDFYARFTSSNTYCAVFKNGRPVCNGDSGGGMVFPKTSSNPNNPVWQLRGLISVSVASQTNLKCDSSHYVVFTDVAKYLDWIRASLD